MGKKMSNAPVYFTVAQVRFNPVLNLESYLPAIQDNLRIMGFPDFRREVFQQLVVSFGNSEAGKAPAPSFQPQARCIFGNIDGTTNFILENNALALQTSDYEVFEKFSEMLMRGLGIVHEELKLDFTERVGLRYLDAVLPSEQESLVDYLAPEVLGLSQKLDGNLSHSFGETVTMSGAGKLVSRVIIQDGHVGLPPEMAQLAPKLNPRFTQREGRHAVIDTDAFREHREVFDLEKLEVTLAELHTEILRSFKVTVTPHAIKSWT